MSLTFSVVVEDTDFLGYRVGHADTETHGLYSEQVFVAPEDALGLQLEHDLRCEMDLCRDYGSEIVAVKSVDFPEVNMHMRHHHAVARVLGLNPDALGQGVVEHDPQTLLERITLARLLAEPSPELSTIEVSPRWIEGGSRENAVQDLLADIERVAQAAQAAHRIVLSS